MIGTGAAPTVRSVDLARVAHRRDPPCCRRGLAPRRARVPPVSNPLLNTMTMKLFLTCAAAALLTTGAAAQGGDDCVNATPIAMHGLYNWNNSTATNSGVNDCNGLPVRKDLWFAWTAPTTERVRFETCNTITAFDTRIAVYDGLDCNNLILLGCNTGGCVPRGTKVDFDAVAGQSYLLRTGSRRVGDSGPGQFRIIPDPCPTSSDDGLEDNDICADHVAIADGTYNNLWCSKSDPDWYSFCVAPGDTLNIDVLFTTADGDVDIFASDDCALNGNIGVGGSASDNENIMHTNAGTADETIYLRVELWNGDPTTDCNAYSMVITGSNGACTPGGIGTNYCTAVPNSTGQTGSMSATGSDVAAANDVTLIASDLPNMQFGIFVTSLDQGFIAGGGGTSNGNICLGGSIGRYQAASQILSTGQTGSFALPINLMTVPQGNGSVAVMAGDSWNFQAWHRDGVGLGSNFTDGLEILFQ